MSGPRSAAKPLRQRRFLDEGRTIVEIHFVRRGSKDQIDAFARQIFFIGRFGPRIARKIRARFELERINKNAHRHFALSAGVFRASRISETCPA